MSSPDDDDDDDDDARPRWEGPPSTWLHLTQDARDAAISLNHLRNEDLSIHLYNAHWLKKRKAGAAGVALNIPEEDQTYNPPKRWTAWPLPPDQVPRAGETVGPDDPDDSYTYKRTERNRDSSSRELEEVMIGVVVRVAKEKWLKRKEAQEEDVDVEDGDSDVSLDRAIQAVTKDTTEVLGGVEASLGQILDSGKEKASGMPPSKSVLKPVVSADDERSRELLRPSMRHTISKLGELLMALHHSRKTSHRYSNSDGNTDDEAQAEAENIAEDEDEDEDEDNLTPAKRPKGRPRKFANLPDRSRARELAPDDADLLQPKAANRGRPKKVYPHLEGETEQEYLVRIARLQKKPLPSFAPPLDPSPSPSPPARKRKSPMKRSTSEEIQVSRRKKLGLRDWSEVLGAAALVGFSPDVIARATKRCADLFGEGMVMRNIVETPFSEKDDAVTETCYKPESVPDFSSEEETENSSSSSKEEVEVRNQSIKRATSRSQNVFCPIAECPRKIRGFRDVANLKRHLMKGHLIEEKDVGEYLLDSDEEYEGAVHVDGYLRGMKGMRRVSQKKGKGKRKEKKDVSESSSSGSSFSEETP